MQVPVYRTMDYRKLNPIPPGIFLTDEWLTYRDAVECLLNEGNEGKHILIQGSTILGVWDRLEDAQSEAQKLESRKPYFLYRIQAEVPCILITRYALCPSLLSPSAQPG
jgi:hypothetical protein